MMNQKTKFESRVWEISTLIKILAGSDIKTIYKVAQYLKQKYTPEIIESLSDQEVYLKYCEYGGE